MTAPSRPTIAGAACVAGAAALAAALAAAAPAASTRQAAATGCSTRGLVFRPASGSAAAAVRIVRLAERDLTCARAQAVARRVVEDLVRGRGISVPGSEGLAISSTSCPGCASKTEVTVRYPRGQVVLSLRDGPRPQAPDLQLPPIPSPGVPTSPAPGGGTLA